MRTACHRSAVGLVFAGIIALGLCLIVAGCRPSSEAVSQTAGAKDLALSRRKSEFRAMFVTTAWNIDWPTKERGQPPVKLRQQIEEIDEIVARAKELHFNVIVLQVRGLGDRIYKSSIPEIPWSKSLGGALDEDPNYDPLGLWIAKAHDAGLELHAWINPFRTYRDDATRLPKYSANGQWWYKPDDEKVQKFLLDGVIAELLSYPPRHTAMALHSSPQATTTSRPADDDGVDGILIDHYLPPPDPDPDLPPGTKPATQADATHPPFLASATGNRTFNVDAFVEAVYTKTKNVERGVKFGLSPDAYDTTHPRTWLSNGWCNYIVPEFYLRNGAGDKDFKKVLKDWTDAANKAPRDLKPLVVAGLFATGVVRPRTGNQQNRRYPFEIIAQMELASRNEAKGHAQYSWKALRREANGGPERQFALGDKLRYDEGPYTDPATVPPCLEAQSASLEPVEPVVSVEQTSEHSVSWKSGEPRSIEEQGRRKISSEATRWLVWFHRPGSGWWMETWPAWQMSSTVPPGVDQVGIQPMDAFNRVGESRTVWTIEN